MAGLAGRERSHVPQRGIHRRPHLTGIAEQNFSDCCQSDTPARPRKQFRTYGSFQPLDAFCERGLCSAQSIRCTAEMPCLGDHFKIGKIAKVQSFLPFIDE
jgi:hypothetical protein